MNHDGLDKYKKYGLRYRRQIISLFKRPQFPGLERYRPTFLIKYGSLKAAGESLLHSEIVAKDAKTRYSI
jgi:hypothetical protein